MVVDCSASAAAGSKRFTFRLHCERAQMAGQITHSEEGPSYLRHLSVILEFQYLHQSSEIKLLRGNF